MASQAGGIQGNIQNVSGPHILADTNVVLDLLLAREPWLGQAQSMWDARDQGRVFVSITASALTDIFYICRRQVGIDRAKQAVETCLQGFDVIGIDRAIAVEALRLPGSDFEDNVQIASALSAGLDLIVTRDIAHFAHSPIPAIEPTAVVAHLDGSSQS